MTEATRWANYADAVALLESVLPVYDAAMARHEAKVRFGVMDTASPEHGKAWAEFCDAEADLDAACRRAKEGQRG